MVFACLLRRLRRNSSLVHRSLHGAVGRLTRPQVFRRIPSPSWSRPRGATSDFSAPSAILHRACSVRSRRNFPRASHGLLLPSDDIGSWTRSTWACLTQHLPLTSFLNSSGAYFPRSLWPCFMPLPPIGFSPSECFPRRQPSDHFWPGALLVLRDNDGFGARASRRR